MKKSTLTLLGIITTILLMGSIAYSYIPNTPQTQTPVNQSFESKVTDVINQATTHPLSIDALREREYPASDIVIEETLAPGSNYRRFITSYSSDGLKIYALLTIPNGTPPEGGWPAIVFNHGYIAPSEYKTAEKYVAYVDGFARNGYVVFRSDYRGHDKSEGVATGGYATNDYTIDVLNAFSALSQYTDVNPEKMGMWGHSMGGHITLRSMVVQPKIKASVIWAGVVASYPDLLTKWRRNRPTPSVSPADSRSWRNSLTQSHGSPESNPQFWDTLSAHTYLSDISGPIQLHHGTADSSVPVEFSQNLSQQMKGQGLAQELYVYTGDDHNLSKQFSLAMRRSIEFFDVHLK